MNLIGEKENNHLFNNEIIANSQRKILDIKNNNKNKKHFLSFPKIKKLMFNKYKVQIEDIDQNENNYSLREMHPLNEINLNQSFNLNNKLINKNEAQKKITKTNKCKKIKNSYSNSNFNDYVKTTVKLDTNYFYPSKTGSMDINSLSSLSRINNNFIHFNNKKSLKQLLNEQNQRPKSKSFEYKLNEKLINNNSKYYLLNYKKERKQSSYYSTKRSISIKNNEFTTSKLIKEINSLLIPNDKTFEKLHKLINERIVNKQSLNIIDNEIFYNKASDKKKCKSVLFIFEDIIKRIYKKMLNKGYTNNTFINIKEIKEEYKNQLEIIKHDLGILKINKEKLLTNNCHINTTGRNEHKYILKVKENNLAKKDNAKNNNNKNNNNNNIVIEKKNVNTKNSCIDNKGDCKCHFYNFDDIYKEITNKKRKIIKGKINQILSTSVDKTYYENKNVEKNNSLVKRYIGFSDYNVLKKRLNEWGKMPKNGRIYSCEQLVHKKSNNKNEKNNDSTIKVENENENEFNSKILSTSVQKLRNSKSSHLNIKFNLNNKINKPLINSNNKKIEHTIVNKLSEINGKDNIKKLENIEKEKIDCSCFFKNNFQIFADKNNKKTHLNEDIINFIQKKEIKKENKEEESKADLNYSYTNRIVNEIKKSNKKKEEMGIFPQENERNPNKKFYNDEMLSTSKDIIINKNKINILNNGLKNDKDYLMNNNKSNKRYQNIDDDEGKVDYKKILKKENKIFNKRSKIKHKSTRSKSIDLLIFKNSLFNDSNDNKKVLVSSNSVFIEKNSKFFFKKIIQKSNSIINKTRIIKNALKNFTKNELSFKKFLEKEKEEEEIQHKLQNINKFDKKLAEKEFIKDSKWEIKFKEFKQYISDLKKMDKEQFKRDTLKFIK